MNILQKIYRPNNSFHLERLKTDFMEFNSDSLFFVFINKERDFWKNHLQQLSKEFPNCSIVGATTSGHIGDEFIYDSECVITAIKFNKAKFLVKTFEKISSSSSFEVGMQIAKVGNELNFKSGFIISEGLNVNGSKLVEGINSTNNRMIFSGGLSGDGADFKETLVFTKDKFISNSLVVIFFDEFVSFSASCAGGWKSFGIERTVTKSENNIVYEIDGRPAINLYKEYLGNKSTLLPSYGLHFPICLTSKINNVESELVRTLLGVDEPNGSLIFAGDVNEGAMIKLMKSSTRELINAAQEMYKKEIDKMTDINGDALSLIVSCLGRRLVMGQNTEEEFVLSPRGFTVVQAGFYSYGEISESLTEKKCSLHNQTFSLTLIWEKAR
ncbi:MAG: FIST N-terminal domain-containing protein [Bacteriovorax sp.]|nr:FIST N-terminal domain-containing protein [Bacteriovorax sp.]